MDEVFVIHFISNLNCAAASINVHPVSFADTPQEGDSIKFILNPPERIFRSAQDDGVILIKI
jgi:hypothetical protein